MVEDRNWHVRIDEGEYPGRSNDPMPPKEPEYDPLLTRQGMTYNEAERHITTVRERILSERSRRPGRGDAAMKFHVEYVHLQDPRRRAP